MNTVSMLSRLPPPPPGRHGFPWTCEVDPASYDLPGYPRLTIVTPSFNQGAFIEHTIRSVLLQNYPNLEFIVIDGGSSDETREILERYGAHLSHWVSEPDRGQSDAINKGIARASGELFNWLNSDDYYEPGALRAVAEGFRDGRSDIFCTACHYVDSEGAVLHVNPPTPLHATWAETLGRAGMNQPGMFYRLERVRQLGGVNPVLHFSMDWELWVRYLLRFGFAAVSQSPVVTANFRLHGGSKTVRAAAQALDEFELDMWNVYRQLADRAGSGQLQATFEQAGFAIIPGYRLACETHAVPCADDLVSALHIYFYSLVLKRYYQARIRQADRFAAFIDSSCLPPHLQADLRYLRRRIRLRKLWSRK